MKGPKSATQGSNEFFVFFGVKLIFTFNKNSIYLNTSVAEVL